MVRLAMFYRNDEELEEVLRDMCKGVNSWYFCLNGTWTLVSTHIFDFMYLKRRLGSFDFFGSMFDIHTGHTKTDTKNQEFQNKNKQRAICDMPFRKDQHTD
jgi:hypothetical protein